MASSHEDMDAIRSTITSVAHHIDRRQWNDLTTLFATEVETDYTSLFGGTPEKQSGEALVGGWRGALEQVATQHLLGPVEVRIAGSTARASCHVRAFHHAPKAPDGAAWEVLGHYRFELARQGTDWKITRMTLETFAQTGNTNLLSQASGASR